jgi:hypothetical protein
MLRTGGVLVLLASLSTSSFAAPRTIKTMYCAKEKTGEWTLQWFRPLIDPNGRSSYFELSTVGPLIEKATLRQFRHSYELSYEFKFDGAGKLIGLDGRVEAWNDHWVAEANLYPDAQGVVGPVHLKFYKAEGHLQIARPEDAREHEDELSRVPLYRTTESLPCSNLLKEAEK